MSSEPPPDVLRLMLREYGRLQAVIEKVDERRFRIRMWVIAVTGASTAIGVNAKKLPLVLTAICPRASTSRGWTQSGR